jgi:hypothetical protein
MSRGGNEARRSFQQELSMNKQILLAGAIVAALAVPFAANAQSNATSGAVGGAVGGAIVGGPVGAVVGGVGGAIVGGIADDRRAGFNTYVVKEKRTSYKYDHDVVVGAELPTSGVTYYEVPTEYGVKNYRYTIVNDRTVLVDPSSHRIVQVIR